MPTWSSYLRMISRIYNVLKFIVVDGLCFYKSVPGLWWQISSCFNFQTHMQESAYKFVLKFLLPSLDLLSSHNIDEYSSIVDNDFYDYIPDLDYKLDKKQRGQELYDTLEISWTKSKVELCRQIVVISSTHLPEDPAHYSDFLSRALVTDQQRTYNTSL